MIVSVIVPAKNEEGNIIQTAERIAHTFMDNNIEGEIIFVDDGSKDNTYSEMIKAAEQFDCIRIYKHYRNKGLSYALNTGFENMRGDIAIFLPADLQFSPEEVIPKFVDKMKNGYDVVVGYKIGKSSFWRKIGSWGGNFFIRFIFRIKVKQMNAVRAFSSSAVNDLELRSEWHALTIPIVASRGWKIGEVPVEVYPRTHGKSKFHLPSFIFAFFDMVSVKLINDFGEKPMLIFGSFAALFLLTALILLAKVGFDWIQYGIGITYLSGILCAGLLVLTLIFLLLGFITELVINPVRLNRENTRQLIEIKDKLDQQQKILNEISIKLNGK